LRNITLHKNRPERRHPDRNMQKSSELHHIIDQSEIIRLPPITAAVETNATDQNSKQKKQHCSGKTKLCIRCSHTYRPVFHGHSSDVARTLVWKGISIGLCGYLFYRIQLEVWSFAKDI